MAREEQALVCFNRGIVSRFGLARSDIKRIALSAETMTNWIPRVLGSMSIRPGLGYIGATKSNAAARIIPFVFATSDTAILEFTNNLLRVWVNDALVTRPSVTSAVANGNPFLAYSAGATFTGGGSANLVYTGVDNFTVDDAVSFTNVGGALPATVISGTVYYVKSVNTGTNTITIAATRPTATAAAITMATAGTGTHTIYDLSLVTSWTDSDESGAYSQMTPAGLLSLVGTGSTAAIRDQMVTVAGLNVGVQHALRITVTNGPVYLRVGTAAGDDSYINETPLDTGVHSLTLTPSGNFNIRLFSRRLAAVTVSGCYIESAGAMELPTVYDSTMLRNIRTDQSADVVFVACGQNQQRLIQRRSGGSWSVVLYKPTDGPFGYINTSRVTLVGSGLSGNITLTASSSFFKPTDVGKLFQMTSSTQKVSGTTASLPPAAGDWTNPVEVQGVGVDRTITINISGEGTSTVQLQRSFGDTSNYSDVPASSWTTNGAWSYADTFDNQIVYYRIGIKQAGYVGTDNVTYQISYPSGAITGIARVTGYTSNTVMNAEVLTPLGDTVATSLWKAGMWSDTDGWPSGVALHEGRCWWSGKSQIWGSISGVFDSFSEDVIGDSGVINRSLIGTVDTIAWMSSNQRLLIGTSSAELSARSSSLDEPLTPTAFSVKPCSTHGSANVPSLKMDHNVIFAQRNGNKLYKLDFQFQKYDYEAGDLTVIIPEIGNPGIIAMAIQRQPDTRIHCVLSDGTVAMLVLDAAEDVNAWVRLTTNGLIEDVVVLPGSPGQTDDLTYYVVKRTINGSTVRFLERMAQSTECGGATLCKLADAFVVVSQVPSYTVNGLSHLEGQNVCVWADGKDLGTDSSYNQTYTVSGGTITLPVQVSNIVVGLPYSAPFYSMKLGSPTQSVQNILNHYKNINHIGLVMADTHPKGLRFGSDATVLDELPTQEKSKSVDPDTIWTHYDEQSIEFPGTWDTDTRIYLLAQAPRPCTMLAVSLQMEVT